MGYGESGREKMFKLSSVNTLKESFSLVQLFVTPQTVACQAPSVRGILQARILEWVAIPFSRGSSWPRDWTQVFCIAGGVFTIWAAREYLNEVISVTHNLAELPHEALQR